MVVMWLLYFFNWLNILENTYLSLFRCCLGSMGKFHGEKSKIRVLGKMLDLVLL